MSLEQGIQMNCLSFFFFFLFLVQNINSSCSDPERRAPGGGESAGEGQRRPLQNIS